MKAMFLGVLVLAGMCASAATTSKPCDRTAALKPGEMAPDFALKGADGKEYKLSQFLGKTVVLEWYNKDCPYVHKFYDSKTMQSLQKDTVAKGTVWLTIASSAPGKEGHLTDKTAMPVMRESGMASTMLLLDDKSVVACNYSAKTTPHMFVIDKKGLLAYEGAIDDHPSAQTDALKGAHNYVTTALETLEKGGTVKDVKEASTTPYGCSVKY